MSETKVVKAIDNDIATTTTVYLNFESSSQDKKMRDLLKVNLLEARRSKG